MEPASVVPGMSPEKTLKKFKQKPRAGQLKAFHAQPAELLTIKLPTGYGKTMVAFGTYAILKGLGLVERMLIIVPSKPQLNQMVNVSIDAQKRAGFEIINPACDVSFFRHDAIRRSRDSENDVFVSTIQYMVNKSGFVVDELLSTHSWLVVVDEYHHYGIDRPFAEAVLSKRFQHLLAMSATPNRTESDEAFPDPVVVVTYMDALKERAVKRMIGHGYQYVVEIEDDSGEAKTFTTQELVKEAGGEDEGKIEQLIIKRQMRWRADYISPLLSYPLERLINQRHKTGQPLQAIIGAMCVSHAKLICSQARDMFGDILRIDWVGTGPDGRLESENESVISKFAPTGTDPVTGEGKRPTLDVLVHVGMAGEGMDSVYVTEVVHCNSAGKNNSNDQENGRAARVIPGHDEIEANINFDTSSEYYRRGYVGSRIMAAFDDLPPESIDDLDDIDSSRDADLDVLDIPDEPVIWIDDIRLDGIDSGDPAVQEHAAWIASNIDGFSYQDVVDKNPVLIECAIAARMKELADRSRGNDEKSVVLQLHDNLKNAVKQLIASVMRLRRKEGLDAGKETRNDIAKEINRRKKYEIGAVDNVVESSLRDHYAWVVEMTKVLRREGLPPWLR